MSEIVKLKIRLDGQELDYEGPAETFASVYQDFLSKVNSPKPTQNNEAERIFPIPENPDSADEENVPQKRNGKIQRGKRSYPNPPMDTSLNLHGDATNPSLRDFFAEKRPSGNLEADAVFAFYLTHYCGLSTFNESHIRACFVNVNARMPAYIRQSLIDSKNKVGYVELTKDGWKIAVPGENLVRHDLPRNKGN